MNTYNTDYIRTKYVLNPTTPKTHQQITEKIIHLTQTNIRFHTVEHCCSFFFSFFLLLVFRIHQESPKRDILTKRFTKLERARFNFGYTSIWIAFRLVSSLTGLIELFYLSGLNFHNILLVLHFFVVDCGNFLFLLLFEQKKTQYSNKFVIICVRGKQYPHRFGGYK